MQRSKLRELVLKGYDPTDDYGNLSTRAQSPPLELKCRLLVYVGKSPFAKGGEHLATFSKFGDLLLNIGGKLRHLDQVAPYRWTGVHPQLPPPAVWRSGSCGTGYPRG